MDFIFIIYACYNLLFFIVYEFYTNLSFIDYPYLIGGFVSLFLALITFKFKVK